MVFSEILTMKSWTEEALGRAPLMLCQMLIVNLVLYVRYKWSRELRRLQHSATVTRHSVSARNAEVTSPPRPRPLPLIHHSSIYLLICSFNNSVCLFQLNLPPYCTVTMWFDGLLSPYLLFSIRSQLVNSEHL